MNVTHIVSGDAARSLARPDQHGRAWFEAKVLDTLGRARGAITWSATTGQPSGPTARHTWCPGTPLPDRTLFVTCTATTR